MNSEGYKHVMQKGLLFGLLFIINFLFSSVFNNLIFSLLSISLSVVIVYLTIASLRKYRDTLLNGAIGYSQVLHYVTMLYFFAALISSAFKYVYFQYINPDYLFQLLEQSLTVAKLYNMSVSSVEIEAMQRVLTPASFALQYVWINILLGTVVGVILGFLVKKNKKENTTTQL